MNDLVPGDCSPAVDRRPPHAAESDPSPGLLVRIARRIVYARLRRLVQGTITVVEGSRRTVFGEPAAVSTLKATITILETDC